MSCRARLGDDQIGDVEDGARPASLEGGDGETRRRVVREAAVQRQGLALDFALGLYRAAQLAVGRQRHGRVEDEALRGDALAGRPIDDVARLDLELQRGVWTAEADRGVRGGGTGHVGTEGGEARQVEREIEGAGFLTAAAGDGQRAAVASQAGVAQDPVAARRQRGVAREVDRCDQPGRYAGCAQAFHHALPARRNGAFVEGGGNLDLRLAGERAAGHGRQRFKARQVDRGADLALVVRRRIVAVAPGTHERHGDVERPNRHLAAREARHRGIDRDGARLGQARVERRKLQLLDLALEANGVGQPAVGLQGQGLPGDTLRPDIDRPGLERGLQAGFGAVGLPANAALCRRLVAGLGRQLRRAFACVAPSR